MTNIDFGDLFNHDLLLRALEECCLQAINDRAQAIILGCTAMVGLTEALYNVLRSRNIFISLVD